MAEFGIPILFQCFMYMLAKNSILFKTFNTTWDPDPLHIVNVQKHLEPGCLQAVFPPNKWLQGLGAQKGLGGGVNRRTQVRADVCCVTIKH